MSFLSKKSAWKQGRLVMKANDVQSSSQKKNNKIAIWIIVALSVLLLVSFIWGVSGAYFQDSDISSGMITTGGPVNIDITQGGASATTLTFSSSAMPGDVFDQAIQVTAPEGTSKAVLRAKLTVSNDDGLSAPVTATTAENWAKNTDDYYYYSGTIEAGNSIDFVTQVEVPTSLTNDDANKSNTISVVVEAIQHANGAARAVWTTAPSDWVAAYGSGT